MRLKLSGQPSRWGSLRKVPAGHPGGEDGMAISAPRPGPRVLVLGGGGGPLSGRPRSSCGLPRGGPKKQVPLLPHELGNIIASALPLLLLVMLLHLII